MINASQIIDLENLKKLIINGYVKERKHPLFPLRIYNYTARCQSDRIWNNETLHCRGLILDDEYNIIARPFKKFFGIHELESPFIPSVDMTKKFIATEKLDGSLGIVFNNPYSGKIEIATRGSFDSEQSIWANNYLNSKIKFSYLPQDTTLLVEIIYHNNTIVVDYSYEGLVALAWIGNISGSDLNLKLLACSQAGIPEAMTYNSDNVKRLIDNSPFDNFEGYVLYFPETGDRVKVKLDEYLRLHKIVTNVSSTSIWELLKTGGSIDEVINKVPQRLKEWVISRSTELRRKKIDILNECNIIYSKGKSLSLKSRKEWADFYKNTANQELLPILFKYLDECNIKSENVIEDIAWKLVKPAFERPHSVSDIDEEK